MKRSGSKPTALPLAVAVAVAAVLTACGGTNSAGSEVVADGSSTVGPFTEAAAELLREENPEINVTVQTSGTGGGFEKFCQGQTDLSNASRRIKDEERAICAENGVEFTELQVAIDALTVVTSAENGFLSCLTTEQLKRIWEPAAEGVIEDWRQLDPAFPAEELELFGPGTDSGTFDYFTDAITGEEGASRTDYNASEDDNVIVDGVAGSPGSLGYFGFTYFEENAQKLKAVQIDAGDGCVTPSPQTAQDGSYTPLARPLFIYVSNGAYAEKPSVTAFVDWVAQHSGTAAEAAQYIPLDAAQRQQLAEAVAGIGS